MFEKIVRKVKQGAMEDAKRTLKKETSKLADDILPQLVGIAYVALLIFSAVPPQKLAAQQVIVNNYFIGRY